MRVLFEPPVRDRSFDANRRNDYTRRLVEGLWQAGHRVERHGSWTTPLTSPRSTPKLAGLAALRNSAATALGRVPNEMTIIEFGVESVHLAPAVVGPTIWLVHHLPDNNRFVPDSDLAAALLDHPKRRMGPGHPRLLVATSARAALQLCEAGHDPGRIRELPPGVDAVTIDLTTVSSVDETLTFVAADATPAQATRLQRLWESVNEGSRHQLILLDPGAGTSVAHSADNVQVIHSASNEDRQRKLSDADLVVGVTGSDSRALVVREAAAAGTSTVAVRQPGVTDAVHDGETGVLVDSDDELVEVWRQLSHDRSALRRYGRAARNLATFWTWTSVAHRFNEVLAEAELMHHHPLSHPGLRFSPAAEPTHGLSPPVEPWVEARQPPVLEVTLGALAHVDITQHETSSTEPEIEVPPAPASRLSDHSVMFHPAANHVDQTTLTASLPPLTPRPSSVNRFLNARRERTAIIGPSPLQVEEVDLISTPPRPGLRRHEHSDSAAFGGTSWPVLHRPRRMLEGPTPTLKLMLHLWDGRAGTFEHCMADLSERFGSGGHRVRPSSNRARRGRSNGLIGFVRVEQRSPESRPADVIDLTDGDGDKTDSSTPVGQPPAEEGGLPQLAELLSAHVPAGTPAHPIERGFILLFPGTSPTVAHRHADALRAGTSGLDIVSGVSDNDSLLEAGATDLRQRLIAL